MKSFQPKANLSLLPFTACRALLLQPLWSFVFSETQSWEGWKSMERNSWKVMVFVKSEDLIFHMLSSWASQVVLVIKNLPTNAGNPRDKGLIPKLGRSPGGGPGNPLQYFCLENPMDRGAWGTIVYGVTKSQTWLEQLSMYEGMHACWFYKLFLKTTVYRCWMVSKAIANTPHPTISPIWEHATQRLPAMSPQDLLGLRSPSVLGSNGPTHGWWELLNKDEYQMISLICGI